ncbi:MAG TPA: hypothetical protein VL485_03990 [Ktedonobacteraceae bacterium]|jgi:hypothetical protein|nr:hypothetical protein [Ktedonobacteraceae bacterium]
MPYNDSSSLTAFLAAYFLVLSVIVIASIVFNIIVYWRICSKAGYSGAMSLLIFVPFGALIMMCILAFGDWPVLRELNQLRSGGPVVQFNQFQGQTPFPQPVQSPYPQPNQPYAQPQQNPYQPGQSYPNNPRYQ